MSDRANEREASESESWAGYKPKNYESLIPAKKKLVKTMMAEKIAQTFSSVKKNKNKDKKIKD